MLHISLLSISQTPENKSYLTDRKSDMKIDFFATQPLHLILSSWMNKIYNIFPTKLWLLLSNRNLLKLKWNKLQKLCAELWAELVAIKVLWVKLYSANFETLCVCVGRLTTTRYKLFFPSWIFMKVSGKSFHLKNTFASFLESAFLCRRKPF